MYLLNINNLTLIEKSANVVYLDKLNLKIKEGEIHALVGMNNSQAHFFPKILFDLFLDDYKVSVDRIVFQNKPVYSIQEAQKKKLFKEVAVLFQNSKACLNRNQKIKKQLYTFFLKDKSLLFRVNILQRRKAFLQVTNLLHLVGIKNVDDILQSYPDQLTHAEAQKVMLVIVLMHNPKLIIADEPLSGLDRRTQVQILKLLYKVNQLKNISVLFISQDIYAASQIANTISVIYRGQVIEQGEKNDILNIPKHPYTQLLIQSDFNLRRIHVNNELSTLKHLETVFQYRSVGCIFGSQCAYAQKKCIIEPECTFKHGHMCRCHFPLNVGRKRDE